MLSMLPNITTFFMEFNSDCYNWDDLLSDLKISYLHLLCFTKILHEISTHIIQIRTVMLENIKFADEITLPVSLTMKPDLFKIENLMISNPAVATLIVSQLRIIKLHQIFNKYDPGSVGRILTIAKKLLSHIRKDNAIQEIVFNFYYKNCHPCFQKLQKFVPRNAEDMKLLLKHLLPGTHERGVLDIYGGTLHNILNTRKTPYPFSIKSMTLLYCGHVSIEDIPFDECYVEDQSDDMLDEESDLDEEDNECGSNEDADTPNDDSSNEGIYAENNSKGIVINTNVHKRTLRMLYDKEE
ncbi:hypothetical protein BDQ17DRAFT_1330443 [Cyathus striatus]|nr:hypothetical protein BDQ17DRAFT_1330443 [Cyathus striatus]